MSAVINSPPTTPVDTQDVNDGMLRPPSEGWRSFFSAAWTICNSLTESGTTAQRPISLLWAGRRFFDTTLGTGGEPIWRNKDNTGWVTLSGGGGGSGTVTSIGTTSPITGGPITTTGTIGIDQASASQDGYLSAADWTTFNNKGNGTVTSVSVAIAADDTVTQSGSPITTSGTSTLTAVDAGSADALVGWDDSAGKKVYFTLGTGLTTTGTVLSFSGTAGHVIEDEGTPLTQRANMNFTGAGVAVTDAGGKTVVTISGSGTAPRLDEILTGTADSTLTTSGTITMTSGTGAANATGKTIAIQPGAGGATTAIGGALTLTGGAAAGNAAGGAVTITGGLSSGSTGASVGGAANVVGGAGIAGGAVNITSGASNAASSGTAGNVVVLSASGVGSQGIGGAITLTGGASNNAQTGGAVTMTGGTGGGAGGAASVIAGTGGTASGTGNGGLAKIQGGTAGAVAGGAGGGASVLAANGSGTGTGGDGGAVAITAGNAAGSAAHAGGNITLQPGSATSTGNPGNIRLDGGRGAALATTAIGGFVTIPTCAGTPTGVPVNVPTGSVALVFDTTNNKLMIYDTAWIGVVLA